MVCLIILWCSLGDSSSEEKATEGDEEEEGEEEPSDQTEDEGGYYNLRKRQPVIYHLKPVHHVSLEGYKK